MKRGSSSGEAPQRLLAWSGSEKEYIDKELNVSEYFKHLHLVVWRFENNCECNLSLAGKFDLSQFRKERR